MRTEGDALLRQLAQLRQRHHLEAAAVGEDRPRPVHEGVQAAERGDALSPRPEHQVVRVAEHDLRAGTGHRLRSEPFTVACVPTGMKAGVCTAPCGVTNSPRRAVPS